MQYMLMIHSDESGWEKLTEEEIGKFMVAYGEVTQAMMEAGVMVGANRLKESATATTVRVRDGELLTTDGPFAELKEQFGGYYMIDVPDLDAAISWARRIPGAAYGAVEVRPVYVEEGENQCPGS